MSLGFFSTNTSFPTSTYCEPLYFLFNLRCGNTALTLAVLGGHTSVVRLLLFWGAAVDIMDPAGRSLLSLAASIGNGPIVQELLARGLDEAHRDHAGCTPLHLAAAGRGSATSTNCEAEATPEQYCEVIR